MDATQLLSGIKTFCETNANAANVKKYSRFFKDEYIAYGLTQPQMRTWVKDTLKDKGVTIETVEETTPLLFASGKYEEITIALLLLEGSHKSFTRPTFLFVENLFAMGINNWAHADTLGMSIVPRFLKKEIIAIEDLRPWLTATNKFQRRTVPVSLIKLLGDIEDVGILFGFIEPLMHDPAREVHQGVGWFLRESWKKRPAETERFLARWRNTAPRLIIQYACEKMAPDLRARFKKSK